MRVLSFLILSILQSVFTCGWGLDPYGDGWYGPYGASQPDASQSSTAGEILPTPTGPYTVGVQATKVTSPEPGTVALPFRVYYPAKPGTGSSTTPPYFPSSDIPEFALQTGIPLEDITEAFSRIVVHAAQDAEPMPPERPEGWPAIVLSPGAGSRAEFSTHLATELASNGYIVAALPDVLLLPTEDASAAPPMADAPMGLQAAPSPKSDDYEDICNTEMEKLDIEQRWECEKPEIIPREAANNLLLDVLMEDALVPVKGLVDTSRIAAGGHSLAGIAAFNMSLTEDRLAAVFNLDGFIPLPFQRQGAPIPALMVTSGIETGPASLFVRPWLTAYTTAVVGLAHGAVHTDLTDLPFLAQAHPLLEKVFVGNGFVSTLGATGAQAMAHIVVRFLDAAMGPHGSCTLPDEQLLEGLGPVVVPSPFSEDDLCPCCLRDTCS